MNSSEGFGRFLDRTLKKLSQLVLQQFKENDIPINIEQWIVLQQVYLAGDEASQNLVTKNSYRNRATTSRLISVLCKKGLLTKERFEGDLKQYKLILTKDGEALVNKALPIVKKLRLIGYEGVDEGDFGDFAAFLRVLDCLFDNYLRYEEERK